MTASTPPLLPGQPEADGEPVFREPWEAHAFAMAVRLQEQGLFTSERKRPAIPTTATPTTATGSQHSDVSWTSSDRTPHGHPIELRDHDFRY